jgi:hypothetical protein
MARPDLFSGIRYYVQLNEVDSDKVKALIANLDVSDCQRTPLTGLGSPSDTSFRPHRRQARIRLSTLEVLICIP